MIKNILYSLFLHSLLLLIIYLNFNLKDVEEVKTNEVAISLIALNGDEGGIKPEEIKEEEKPKPKEEKKPEIKKETPKKEVKKEIPKKEEPKKKPEPEKEIKKPEKTKELKKPEKSEAKPKPKEEKPVEEIKKEEKQPEKKEEKKEEKPEEQEAAKEVKKEETKSASFPNKAAEMANTIESLNLSAREKFNIQSQLKRCYRRAIEESGLSSDEKIMIKVTITQDGYIESDLENIIDQQRYQDANQRNYKIAINNVRRAIDFCSPLRNLPRDKYDIWKEVVLEFDEKEDLLNPNPKP